MRVTLFTASSSPSVSSEPLEGAMRGFPSVRFALALLVVLAALLNRSRAFDGEMRPAQSTADSPYIVIGFVGGFVTHDNPHHGVVQLAGRIGKTLPQGTYVHVFENRHRRQARATIFDLLDTNHDGILSDAERARAHIVLFGQSWGASAAVSLARDLQREGVPVLLTVQVDSVAKLWQNDSVIPGNVSEAVNFYQTHGLVHGRRRIVAANPTRTEILGNYLVDYRKNPVQCPDASWVDRFFTPSHMQSECDTHLWTVIESMVRQRITSQDVSAQTLSGSAIEERSQRQSSQR
jgi:hypothetical protein